MTKHPEGKQGVNLDKHKYETIKNAIIEVLKENQTTTFKELTNDVKEKLGNSFDGSITWYVTTIKLDLKVRNIIEQIQRRPQTLKLVSQ